MPEKEISKDELLQYTIDANVHALIRLQNMLSNEHIEEAKSYIDELLKSDKKELHKEVDIPEFVLSINDEYRNIKLTGYEHSKEIVESLGGFNEKNI